MGLRVAVVTFESREVAEDYVSDTDLRWPLLIDPSRSLYTAYGMHRGSRWAIWGPATWWAYAKLLARGRRPSSHRQRASAEVLQQSADVQQLGGDVLIDPGGTVVTHHVGDGPADRPAISELLGPVRAAERAAPRT